ncbi:alpha/beta-hydrolase [Trametes meyenii]|nr:alpha/beta-hydrolase [Trametes meyenii]
MSSPARGSIDDPKCQKGVVQLHSGTTLEYILLRPGRPADSAPKEPEKLAVCLHPWSWLGGRMDDPVLDILTNPLLERGFNVLRYNSRGVGRSKGWPSFTGGQEVEDLKELVNWARSNTAGISKLMILGYSHGSLIASMFPVLQDVDTSHVLLSYPLGPRHWLTAFHTGRYTTALHNLVRDPKSNVLIIYGDDDNFTDVESYDAWAAIVQNLHTGGEEVTLGRGNLKVVKIKNASHFWRERETVTSLINAVWDWAL